MNYISHHGIPGQKWGQRNGPPYPLKGGDYSPEEEKHLTGRTLISNTSYNKKHYDNVIDRGHVISTVTRDPDRIKDAEMFYGAYKFLDRHQYNGLFNKKAEEPIYDDEGNVIGYGKFFKYRVDSKAAKDINVASEDSSVEAFADLYKNNRDFYNFVIDEDRLEKAFRDARAGRIMIKPFREALTSLEQIRKDDVASYEDVGKVYRLFNYVLPYDGDNQKLTKDVKMQRTKLFNKLKSNGYSALLDVNDALYNYFNADTPVIVFDVEAIIPGEAKRTNIGSVTYSRMVAGGRKALGI